MNHRDVLQLFGAAVAGGVWPQSSSAPRPPVFERGAIVGTLLKDLVLRHILADNPWFLAFVPRS